MSNNPDQIRSDIERTRGELEVDVDALAEKVRPSSVVHRQADRARGAMSSVKDRVMGTAHGAEGRMHETSERMGERMHEGQQKARQTFEGNPLAVGLVALGAGLLIATLIPPSRKERELAETAKERTQDMQHEVADAAKRVATEVKDDVSDTAKDAARDVADTAKDAADNVKSEGSAAAHDVKDTASDAAGHDMNDSSRGY